MAATAPTPDGPPLPPRVSPTLPDPPPRRRRALRVALVTVLVLAALAGVAALFLPGLIRAEIARQARARGVELDPGEVSLSLDAVRLADARFTLVDAPGVDGALRKATIRLDGLTARRVEVEGLGIAIAGVEALPALQAWAAARHGAIGELPLSARSVRLGLKARGNAPEVAALLADTLVVTPARSGDAVEVAIRGGRVAVAAREVARAEVTARLDAKGIEAAIAAALPGGAAGQPIRIELRRPPAADLVVRLPSTSIDAVAAPLGLSLRAPGVSVGGAVELRLPREPGGAYEAGVDLVLDGYVPPHPRELDGILFGRATTVKGAARIPPGGDRADLRDLVVSAGALRLTGSGDVRRELADATLHLDLSGAVPCSQLTGSAVSAHLGRAAGDFAGNLARRALAGSVAVQVRIDARASRFDAPRVETSARVGCRLKLL